MAVTWNDSAVPRGLWDVGLLTCGLGTMLAAMAGVFYMLLYIINPFIGLPLTLRYLCIIVLGGLGSLFGSLVGGVMLGLTEVFTGYLLNPHWQETVAFLMLVVVLLVRPQGCSGAPSHNYEAGMPTPTAPSSCWPRLLPYYALATFGLLKLCEELALTLSGLTEGSGGLSVVWPENLTLSYFLNLGLAVCTFLTVWLVSRSRFGLGPVSMREDEQVARAFGVSVSWYKCAALVVSAVPAAVLGPIYLSDRLYINPGEMFGLEIALMPITMAILSGSGLLIGPVVGVVFLSLVQEVLWTQLGVLRLASLGLVLALVGLRMPGGLVRLPPVYTRLRRWGLVQEG